MLGAGIYNKVIIEGRKIPVKKASELRVVENVLTPVVEEKPVVLPDLPEEKKITPVHIVKKGESLWQISRKYYGKGSAWILLKTQNESTLIHPGEIVEIPDEIPSIQLVQ